MQKKISIIIGVLLAATVSLLGFMRLSPTTSDGVQISFLDVGQGDATFITWGDGVQMLVDCGEDARVLEALGRNMAFFDKHIDYLVVTHPDRDHYGGCIDVLRRFTVANVVYTGMQKEDKAWNIFLAMVEQEGARIHIITKKQDWQIASSTLSFLYPDHDVRLDAHVPGYPKKESDNNTSIVMKLVYGESSLLLPGDAEQELEEYLVKQHGDEIDVDVLKASHHGSGGSSIKPFLEAASPQHTVISAGRNNRYGHPSRRVLKRLERIGSTIWRTDIQNDILFVLYSSFIQPPS